MKSKFDTLMESVLKEHNINLSTDTNDFETMKLLFLNLAVATKHLCEDNSYDAINKAQNEIQKGLDFLGLPYFSIDETSPDFALANILKENKK